MRADEMYALNTAQGCTTETIDRQKIHVIHANLSKTAKGSQSKQDEFVTTEIGMKAYEVLQALHTPLRKRHPSSLSFFHKIKGCSSFQTTVHYPLMLLGRYSNAALIAAYETASSHQSRHWTLTSEFLKGLRRHLAPILLLLYRGGH